MTVMNNSTSGEHEKRLIDWEAALDELQKLGAKTWINIQGSDDRGYFATIQMTYTHNLKRAYWTGKGRNRVAAVQDAIFNASKGNEDGNGPVTTF